VAFNIMSKMRIGYVYMGQQNSATAELGYLPYTLNVDFWVDLARDTTITRIKHMPDVFPHHPTVLTLVELAYGLAIAGLFCWSVDRGIRLTGFGLRELMTKANDELTVACFERFTQGMSNSSGQSQKVSKRDESVYGEAVMENA